MNEDQWKGLLKDQGSDCADALETAIDTLGDVIQQACSGPGDKWQSVDSMALSAYADGIRLLAAHGRVAITAEAGRRVIATWVRDE